MEIYMENIKFKPRGINWRRLESAAWRSLVANESNEDRERLRKQVAERIDEYIRDGGIDRDIAELDFMFVDENLKERLDAIGNPSLWTPEMGNPAVVTGTSGRYGHKLVLKQDDMDPSGVALIAWWSPCSREVWMDSTFNGKPFLSSLVNRLASRKEHTVMDAVRKTFVDRLSLAEKAMCKRINETSGFGKLVGSTIPKGIWDYIKSCESEVLGEEEL
jgi:hypothetical protein